ncbi:protein of unknown function [Caballeronia sp. S22]
MALTFFFTFRVRADLSARFQASQHQERVLHGSLWYAGSKTSVGANVHLSARRERDSPIPSADCHPWAVMSHIFMQSK